MNQESKEEMEHRHSEKPSSSWREFKDRGWQSCTCSLEEQGVMHSTCQGPHARLCRDLVMRCWPDTSPPLCKGLMLVTFLPGGDRGRAVWCMQL